MFRWRITPVKVAQKDGYIDEHICVVEKVPGAMPLSPELLPFIEQRARGEKDLTLLWVVLGIGVVAALLGPSVFSFPTELQAMFRWRITPVKVAQKDGYIDEHICVVEKVPGAMPLSPELLPFIEQRARGEKDLTLLWVVLGIGVVAALLGVAICVIAR
ncbi:transmembrane [Cyclospora cayetanensis]|uniref:Transmembrane n=1 Tax=Cyclospora cayetanensis TaxID=88456 RepID=A0A1D3CYC7_9EIME|nr:transmembrane [Cyclospora cayetanensis]